MNIRNVCIIAHVDHGKTTLVDHLLQQSGSFGEREQLQDRVMDSMDLEKERGITIQAKNASLTYKDTTINIIDTPGHADFGGEVERIMSMADGAILLVDAAEGPLPQTRFVLQKALEKGHKVILVINKVDRPECSDGIRTQEVVNQTFDLFVELGANENQLDFPILYTVARDGWSTDNADEVSTLLAGAKGTASLQPLFEAILTHIPSPVTPVNSHFQLLVTNIGWSEYVGRLCLGRVMSSRVTEGQTLFRQSIDNQGNTQTQRFTATKIFRFKGLKQIETSSLEAGDIGVLAGCETVEIGDTITDNEASVPLPRIEVEKPTLGMIFSVNTSPFSGKEGEAIQSRKLRERLIKEIRQNVALRFEETEAPDQFRMLGRGELQFGVLIEQMRREGLEFMVGRPVVLMRKNEAGEKEEPLERVTLDLPEEYSGDITRMFQERKGILSSYENLGENSSRGRVRLCFDIPTRGLLGMRTRVLTATRGEGIMSAQSLGYTSWKGEMLHRQNGALISDRDGEAVTYALNNLEDRGILFVKPGTPVYEGMVVGEFNKENDLNVNPTKEKKLTNVRASGSDDLIQLKGVREMTLEKCIEWIDDDEWIEVTPQSIRIRKKVLKSNMRSIIRREKV